MYIELNYARARESERDRERESERARAGGRQGGRGRQGGNQASWAVLPRVDLLRFP